MGNPDAYSSTAGKPLTVAAAAGVLANDSDPNGRSLTAIVATGPSNGTLTLNADGSFTYTPTSGFVGSDSFTYRANDGINLSLPITVSLVVNSGNAGTTGQPPHVVTTFPVMGTQNVPIVSAPIATFNDGDGSTPPSFRPISLSSTGPIARYLPTLAALATGQTTVAIQQLHSVRVAHPVPVHSPSVHVQHGKARPNAVARRHK